MKTERSFSTFTDSGPNKSGTYDIKLVEHEEGKPAVVEEEKKPAAVDVKPKPAAVAEKPKPAAVDEKPKSVTAVETAEEDELTRMARIE